MRSAGSPRGMGAYEAGDCDPRGVPLAPVVAGALGEIALDTRLQRRETLPPLGGAGVDGDWFAAESVLGPAGKGYRHTVFTRFAPIVAPLTDGFDQELENLLPAQGIRPEDAPEAAIGVLKGLLYRLARG
jgi:hypothetical protein